MTHAIAMGSPVRRPATYADVLAAPPHLIAQLVDDELHLQPRPAGPHNFFASGLGADLVAAFQRGRGGPGGWVVLSNLSFTSAPTSWSPISPRGASRNHRSSRPPTSWLHQHGCVK